MNKSRLIGIILTIAASFGAKDGYEFAIENYGETEIVMPDGTVYEAKDIARHPTKAFPERDLEDIDGIAYHYLNWDTEDIQRVATWHVDGNHWPGIGYHGAIKRDGTYLVLNSLETLSYHAKGSNTKLIGIVFLGDTEKDGLTVNQIKTAKYINEALCNTLDIRRIVGHRDVRSTNCPGDVAYETCEKEEIFFNNH